MENDVYPRRPAGIFPAELFQGRKPLSNITQSINVKPAVSQQLLLQNKPAQTQNSNSGVTYKVIKLTSSHAKAPSILSLRKSCVPSTKVVLSEHNVQQNALSVQKPTAGICNTDLYSKQPASIQAEPSGISANLSQISQNSGKLPTLQFVRTLQRSKVPQKGLSSSTVEPQQSQQVQRLDQVDEIRNSRHFEPLQDIVSELQSAKQKKQSKKGLTETTAPRIKQVRSKPSVLDMNATSEQMPSCLEDILPSCYNYVVVHFSEQPQGFSAIVRTNISDKDGVLSWIDLFQEVSYVDLRSKDTFKENSDRIVFKKVYRCHADTRADEPCSKTKTPHGKHSVCLANVIVTVKNKNMKRSADTYLQSHPCEITINHIHNHGIFRADSLRQRRPCKEVKEKMVELFNKGYSPSTALHAIKFDLQIKHGLNYFKYAANGSLCPTYKWAYNLYYAIFQAKYGPPSGDEMIETLKMFVDQYNSGADSECAKLSIEGADVAIAICSPLMKRVHKELRSSGETVFVDSSGNMDFQNTRVFLFVCPSVCGALPLGVVFTNSEATFPLTKGFKLLQDILPEDAFYGRGKEGPKIFMTDDSAAERMALGITFTATDLILLLCKFHLLSAVWKNLQDSTHAVKPAYRPELYFLFKQLVDCPEEDKFNLMYDELLSLSIVNENKKIKDYFIGKRESAKHWAMAFRSKLLTRGHDTNNYNEACTKAIKDVIMRRIKAFSVVQLFSFMTEDLEAYFKRRICDCLNNRMVNYTSSRYYIQPEKLIGLSCQKISDNMYEVHNSESNQTYKVDLTIDVCSCPVGRSGAPCKHQYFVVKSHNLTSSQFVPTNDPKMKLILHQIMDGTTACVPENWYDNHKFVSANESSNGHNEDDTTMASISTEVHEEEVNSVENGNNKTLPVENTDITSNANAAALLSCMDQIDKMAADMKKRLSDRPEVYLPAFDKYMQRYEECAESESKYVSAFFMFNRSSHAPLRRGNLLGTMSVQPTAVGRRTKKFGGKHAQTPGRPSAAFQVDSRKRCLPPEGNYANLPKKRKVPHAISKCVASRNVPVA